MVEADLQKMKPKLSNGPNPNPCHTTLHMGVKEAERGGLPLLDLPSYISECLTLAACLKLASSRVPCTYGPFSLFFRAPEVSVKVHLCHISALWMRETVGEGKSLGNLLPPPPPPLHTVWEALGSDDLSPLVCLARLWGVWMALPLFPATAGSECEVENLLLFIPDCCFMWCHVSLSFIPEIWNTLFIKFTLSNPQKSHSRESYLRLD